MKKRKGILCALLFFICISGCGKIREKEEPAESAESIKRDEVSYSDSAADVQVQEEAVIEGIIEEQSFETEIDGWGKVRFISAAPKGEQGAPHFMLIRDGEVVYTFPESGLPKTDEFKEVIAVSFEDYNGDEKKDIIALIRYQNGVDVWTEALVFLQENSDNMFYMDYPDMTGYRIDAQTENGPAFYRDRLLEEYLLTQRLTDTVADIRGTWVEYMDYVDSLSGFAGVEEQLMLLAKCRGSWITDPEYAEDRCCFTVTDLDGDGLLEVIVANQGGTGNYTYSRFYETDGNGNLRELETSFTEGDSEPDIIEEQMTVYSTFLAEGMRNYYIVYDYLKAAADYYICRVSSLCMMEDFILETPLASQTISYVGEEKTPEIVSEDCRGNLLTEEEFEAFPETYYNDMGMEKKTVFFHWMDVSELSGKSDEETAELLRQSYEGFHR